MAADRDEKVDLNAAKEELIMYRWMICSVIMGAIVAICPTVRTAQEVVPSPRVIVCRPRRRRP